MYQTKSHKTTKNAHKSITFKITLKSCIYAASLFSLNTHKKIVNICLCATFYLPRAKSVLKLNLHATSYHTKLIIVLLIDVTVSVLEQTDCDKLKISIYFLSTMKHIYYHLKLPSCSQLISLNKYLEKLAYIYYRNAFYVAICVEFERKNNTIMALLLSNCLQVLTIFYDWLLEYYFWWFRHICLLG